MDQVQGRPGHPQTQGKIVRYHESLNILTTTDVYFGQVEAIMEEKTHKKNYFVAEKKKNTNIL
jgi:hypothetical protein